jgi:hypothetical protein
MAKNPFSSRNPCTVNEFVNRKDIVNRVVNRLLNSGQSSAIVGEPRMGKTSLMLFISDLQNRNCLFGETGDSLLFQYLDAETLGNSFSQADFWVYALQPISTRLLISRSPANLLTVYQNCRANQFGTFVIEQLLAQMKVVGWHLVLLLDEFDYFLHHPILNGAEFFGGLRSLASRYGPALTLIIANRQSLSSLNDQTQQFSRTGSPYFNFLHEDTLGGFSEKDARELLTKGKGKMTGSEKKLILRLAGGHPFLLQAGAAALWEAYLEDEEGQAKSLYVCNELFKAASGMMDDTWRNWPVEVRQVFAIVALDNMPSLLGERDFDISALLHTLPDYNLEIRYLDQRGFITADERLPGGWRVSCEVMLWWLADVLAKALKDKDNLGNFLYREQWDGLWKIKEKSQFIKSVKWLGTVGKTGAEAFIKAAAEGFGKGISTK